MVQKYISQMGLFRLALTALYEEKDPLFDALLEKGFLYFDEREDVMTSVLEPRDRRGELPDIGGRSSGSLAERKNPE